MHPNIWGNALNIGNCPFKGQLAIFRTLRCFSFYKNVNDVHIITIRVLDCAKNTYSWCLGKGFNSSYGRLIIDRMFHTLHCFLVGCLDKASTPLVCHLPFLCPWGSVCALGCLKIGFFLVLLWPFVTRHWLQNSWYWVFLGLENAKHHLLSIHPHNHFSCSNNN